MLSDQRILITGANGGIGCSIIKLFLKNNAKLILFYHQKRTCIDNLLEQHPEFRSLVDVYQVDLLDNLQIEQALKSVLNKGSIDGFIHSVTPPLSYKKVTDLIWKDYQLHLDIQTKSFLNIVKLLIPGMKMKKYGRIINILTSFIVGCPPSHNSDYIMAKYALLGLTKSLAIEMGQFGITVNSISPSMTNTPLISNLPSTLKEMTVSKIPVGKLAEPNDIASAALFLCSKYASYISGENLIVSGGQVMH